jgi:hypothetical protein
MELHLHATEHLALSREPGQQANRQLWRQKDSVEVGNEVPPPPMQANARDFMTAPH